MPIRWKLILAIGGPLVVVMTTLLVLDYQRLRSQALELNSERVTEIAQRHAARYKGIFDTVAQVARMGAAFASSHADLSEGELYQLLYENVDRNRLVYGSCIAFEPGAFTQRGVGMPPPIPEAPRVHVRPNPNLFAPYVFRGHSGIERLDVANVYDYTLPEWDWYVRTKRTLKEGWSDPFLDKDAGDVPMVTFSAPISRNGVFVGVVTVDVQLEQLRRDSLKEGSRATDVYIIDKLGRYLLAPGASTIMNETVFQTASKINSPELAEIARDRILSGKPGTGAFVDSSDNQKLIVYFAPIDGTEWFLGCVSPENYFLGGQMAALRVRMVIGVGLVAVILAVVALMGSWIVRPVGKLAAAVRLVGAGNMSALVETRSRDEIGQLGRGFNTMVEELRRHMQALTKETAARQAVESELTIARAIQTSLLPREFPQRTEFDLFALSSPARQVGGDFFDFFFIDEHVLVVVIADVSGKGVPAAIFMAVARTLVRDLAASGNRSPAEVLEHANAVMARENSEGMFVTLFLGRYDTRTGEFRYACAGHPPAYLVTAAGEVRRCTESTGTVLGVFADAKFVEESVMVVPGDRLVFYTDGVPEARARSGEFYREPRFEALLAAQSGRGVRDMCEAAMADVQLFQDGDPHDDITLMALSRTI